MPLARDDFSFVRELVYERSGIVLDDSKEYLVETRLMPVARTLRCQTIGELIAQMRGKVFGKAHRAVIEAMTTNETSFFRDNHPFETFRKELLPRVIESRSTERSINIWCAASSSGQEPYSLAMVIRDSFPQLASWKVRILATDISCEMVDRARAGIYSQLEVNRGLPANLLAQYFSKDGMVWQLSDEIRRMVVFQELNLNTPFPPLPSMDMIFMRNVLIYFDMATKRDVLQRIRKVLHPEGYLFLGGAETTFNIDDSYERITLGKTICYRKRSRVMTGADSR